MSTSLESPIITAVNDPRLTEHKRLNSGMWQRARDMLRESEVFTDLDETSQRNAVDRAWAIAETEPLSYAVTRVLLMIERQAPPDLSDVPTADLLAEVARRIDR